MSVFSELSDSFIHFHGEITDIRTERKRIQMELKEVVSRTSAYPELSSLYESRLLLTGTLYSMLRGRRFPRELTDGIYQELVFLEERIALAECVQVLPEKAIYLIQKEKDLAGREKGVSTQFLGTGRLLAHLCRLQERSIGDSSRK